MSISSISQSIPAIVRSNRLGGDNLSFGHRLRLFGKILLNDARSRAQYGSSAPVKFQLLFVDPRTIRLSTKGGFRAQTGRLPHKDPRTIVGGDWDLDKIPLETAHPGIVYARRRVQEGTSWEQTGELAWLRADPIRRGALDGPVCEGVISDRYAALEALLGEVRRTQRLKSQRELSAFHFREWNGINIMISREGEICAAGGGNHRLGIAQALQLEIAPASVVCVHPACIENGLWKKLQAASAEFEISN